MSKFQQLPIVPFEDKTSSGVEDNLTQINIPQTSKQRTCANIKFKILAALCIAVIICLGVVLLRSSEEQVKEEDQNSLLNQFYDDREYRITTNYPTLGVPQPGKTFNFSKVKNEDLHIFDDEINKLFKPYNDTNCDMVKMGLKNGDGGYLICKNFLDRAKAIVNIGILNEDSFGCDLSSYLLIPNYQYDCTSKDLPKCSSNHRLNRFYPVCVDSMTRTLQEGVFFSLKELIQSQYLQKKHIILKIDAQGGEFGGFRHFPVEYLDYIDQIVMEVHFLSQSLRLWGNLQIFRTLTSKFVNLNYHMNNYGCVSKEQKPYRKLPSNAFEVTLVNKKLITLNSESRSYQLHPLNTINSIEFEDCQMFD